jgi:hypothetical protein
LPSADIYQDTFHPEYGVDGTGDIFKEENVRQLELRIDQGTLGKGVQLMCADGGEPCDGEFNEQEYIAGRLGMMQVSASASFQPQLRPQLGLSLTSASLASAVLRLAHDRGGGRLLLLQAV